MTAITQCAKCGARFDSSAVPAGVAFTCGSCGEVLRVDRPAPPPELPSKGKRKAAAIRGGPTRRRLASSRHLDDESKRRGKARVRASKLCSTSFYAGILGVIFLFLSPLGGIAAGLVALVSGVWGVVWLSALGPGDPDDPDASPIERVGAKMARRGRREGWSGLGLALCVLAWYALRIFELV